MKRRSAPATAAEPADLAARLGPSHAPWIELLAHLEAAHGPTTRAWKPMPGGGDAYLRVRRKDRTILYLIPGAGSFVTVFVLGERAVRAMRDSGVPGAVIRALEAAQPYVEGRSLRLPTRTAADLAVMKTLAAIKMDTL